MNQQFDVSIVGAGCAGLQLLYHLSQQKEWRALKILLIGDQAEKNHPSWCFWAKPDHPLQHLVSKSWNELRFKSLEAQLNKNVLHHIVTTIYREWPFIIISGSN